MAFTARLKAWGRWVVSMVVTGIVIAGLVFAAATGIIDVPWLTSYVRQTAFNAGITLPTFSTRSRIAPGGPAQAAQCRENLTRIRNAKAAIQQRSGMTLRHVDWNQVKAELRGAVPSCPGGGQYLLGSMQELPRCSVGACGTSDTSDDHIIKP